MKYNREQEINEAEEKGMKVGFRHKVWNFFAFGFTIILFVL
ncbi:hypothetical protein [Virgibacillus sp. DJP39]